MISEGRIMRKRAGFLTVMVTASICASTSAIAVEGGSGAYLLGSRDILAGIVPPPGFYFGNDVIYIDAKIEGLSISGAVATDVGLTAIVDKMAATYSTSAMVLGGRFALSVQLPVVSIKGDFDLQSVSGVPVGPFSLSDSQFGLGDLAVIPMLGYDSGSWHFNLSAPVYLPTGQYSDATVSLGPPVEADILSISKNKFGIDPTVGMTYLDPATGFEFTSALGITFSAYNDDTDYQTAPELHLEGTIAQHLPNGFVLAATGYAYQQLGNDSGQGAEDLQTALGAKSLEARVFGAGPLIGYSTKIGDTNVSMKLKYIHEFGAKRRFESNVIWGNITFAF
jgi:hypothetical protein